MHLWFNIQIYGHFHHDNGDVREQDAPAQYDLITWLEAINDLVGDNSSRGGDSKKETKEPRNGQVKAQICIHEEEMEDVYLAYFAILRNFDAALIYDDQHYSHADHLDRYH